MTTALRLPDKLPLIALIPGPVGFAPCLPAPYIIQKLRMLGQGALTRPPDIAGLFCRAVPLALLLARLARVGWLARGQP